MTCRQASTYNGTTGSGKAGGGGHATEAECLQACKEGACCEGTTCSVKPQCQCQGAGKTFKGVGTTCTPNPCPCCGCFGCFDACDRYTFSVSNVGPELSDICAGLLKDRHGQITINTPSGMTFPVRVTINGSVDDDLVVNGVIINANNPVWRFPPPYLGNASTPRCNGSHNICHTFDLYESSFTLAAQNNFVSMCGYDVRVCFCQNPLP